MNASRREPLSTSPGPARKLHSTGDVGSYYDRFTDTYLGVTGDFLQAFRSRDTDALMAYLVRRMGLRDGMRVLDAGCGVGAPALWIARQFPRCEVNCLTNSRRQGELARQRVSDADLTNRVHILEGDYHRLEAAYPASTFDRVVFLESLGHSQYVDRVIQGVETVLKPHGSVYIKDFFKRNDADAATQQAIQTAVEAIDDAYCYNTMHLSTLIGALIDRGFRLQQVGQPDLVVDHGITVAFEHASNRLSYPAYANVHAVDWYDVLATRS